MATVYVLQAIFQSHAAYIVLIPKYLSYTGVSGRG